MRGGIQRAFCQSRRPSFEGQQNAAHAEDGRFQPVADCRFSIFDCRFAKRPPLWRLKNVLFKVRNGAETRRNVKNGTTSGDVLENKGQHDNLPDTKDDISARLHAILHGNTRILQKPSALMSQFERWERTQRSQM